MRIPKKKLQLGWSQRAPYPRFYLALVYMYSWTKEANDNVLKTTYIQGRNKAEGRLWKLIIVAEEPEGITGVDDEMYKEVSAARCKA